MNLSPARRVPPLNALRTFEVAARRRSFTAAAEELHVTPGAVSRQVQVLEEFLGLPLFERSHRQVTLTAAGQQYFNGVESVFRQIEAATRQVSHLARSQPLRIWSAMTFALRWLVPRLPAFHQAFPTQDVVFSTSLRPVDFDAEEADVAIRIGEGNWPGLISELLISIELVPVCSPSLVAGPQPLRHSQDLVHHTLLHSAVQPDRWSVWLNATGGPDIPPERGITFESVSLAYQAAIEGLGVVIGQHALIVDDLAQGRLVSPFGPVLNTKLGFYLIYPGRLEQSERLRHFRSWILDEALRDQQARAKRYGLSL